MRDTILFIEEHQVCETLLNGLLDDTSYLEIFPLIILTAWYGSFDLFHKVKDFTSWPPVGGHQYPWCGVTLKIFGEFIYALLSFNLIIFSIRDDGLIFYSHAFNSLCHPFGCSFLPMLLSDLLLLQFIDFGLSAILHFFEENYFLSLVLVPNICRVLNFDRLLFVVLFGHRLYLLV